MIVIEREYHLLGVERLGAVDIQDGDRHEGLKSIAILLEYDDRVLSCRIKYPASTDAVDLHNSGCVQCAGTTKKR